MLKKYSILLMIVAVFAYDAQAAVKVKNQTANRYQEEITGYYDAKGGADEIDDSEAIAILENDIRILDEEIAKCKKQKKGWIAATVIGAVGTVATGVAAGVQGVKLKEKKEDYETTKNEWDSVKKELTKKKQDLEKSNQGDNK